MTAYAYRTRRTPLHSYRAGYKLSALFGLSILSFFFGPAGLAAATALVAVGARCARLGPTELFAGSKPLAVATGAIALIGALSPSPSGISFNSDGAYSGALLFWGVLVSFCAGSILFATTTTGELRCALERGEAAILVLAKRVLGSVPLSPVRAFASRLHGTDLSLVLALTLAFIPRVFSVWEAAEDAHRARCGRGGIFGIASVLPLAAERLIEAAVDTARALEARGYNRGSGDRA